VNFASRRSTFPNWAGEEQKRVMTVIGDEMKYFTSVTTVGGGTNYLVWERVK